MCLNKCPGQNDTLKSWDGLAVPSAAKQRSPRKKGINNYNYREMRAVGEFDLETNFAPHFRVIKHSDAGVQTSWEWTTGALEVKLFLVIFSGVLIPNTCSEWLIFGLGWGEMTCEKIGGVRHIWGIGITRPKICFPLRGTSRTPRRISHFAAEWWHVEQPPKR
jgi:hypothetical protein